MGIVWKQR